MLSKRAALLQLLGGGRCVVRMCEEGEGAVPCQLHDRGQERRQAARPDRSPAGACQPSAGHEGMEQQAWAGLALLGGVVLC